jgi:SAM-dependent methyltransferase
MTDLALGTAVRWATIDSFAGNTTSPALTAYRPCPICGSLRWRSASRYDAFQFFTDDVHAPKRADVVNVQCLDCFAAYLNPAYTERGFQVLFAEAGQSYGATDGRTAEQIGWLSARGLLAPGRQVLDAGCYDGRFLAELPAHCRKLGVDIDAPALERGRRLFGSQGIEFVLGDFETFRYAGRPDTITMFHVLEHLPRPVSVLRNLRTHAGPDTRLVVEVPILENGFTNDMVGFLSPQHMTHFSRRSLANALAAAGWRIEERHEQPDYNGCRVLAAPSDPEPVVAGEAGDVELLQRLVSHWQGAIAAVAGRLSAVRAAERVAIWGGGMHLEALYQRTSLFFERPGREFVLVDGDPLKQGRTWRGLPIQAPARLAALDWEATPLVIASYGSQEKIAGAAVRLGVPPERIVKLYDRLRVY